MTGHAGLLTWGIEHHKKRFVFLLQKPSQFLVNEPKKIKTDLYPRTPLIICVTTSEVNIWIHRVQDHLSEGRGVIFPNRQDLSFFSLLNFNLKEDGKICYRFKYLLKILDQYLHCWDVEVAWLGLFSLQNLWLETFSSLTHPKKPYSNSKSQTIIDKPSSASTLWNLVESKRSYKKRFFSTSMIEKPDEVFNLNASLGRLVTEHIGWT